VAARCVQKNDLPSFTMLHQEFFFNVQLQPFI
jgi:hypothetical protein